jgi:hypothetical protein
MSTQLNKAKRVVNEALNAQWVVTITYRSERGPVTVVHHIKELLDLHDLINHGPCWDALIEVKLVPNPLQPTYSQIFGAAKGYDEDKELCPCWIATATYRSDADPVVVVYHVEELFELQGLIGRSWSALIEMKVILKPYNSLWPGITIEAAAKL